jgi:hypothetical protein
MKQRLRWTDTLIALSGLIGCAVVILGFLWSIANNALPWVEGLSAANYYTAVGAAYNKGFVSGFFFSFFLVLLAVVGSAYIDSKRRNRRATDMPATEEVEGVVSRL